LRVGWPIQAVLWLEWGRSIAIGIRLTFARSESLESEIDVPDPPVILRAFP
jgi:hypothetical protein